MYLLIPLSPLNHGFKFCNLHSIMYLLILKSCFTICMPIKFTFHNVSINSHPFCRTKSCVPHLHSIMYLLILKIFRRQCEIKKFTFHNVSINSISRNVYILPELSFTFHNVSINSRPPTTIISSIVFLLFLSTSFYSPHLISIFLL